MAFGLTIKYGYGEPSPTALRPAELAVDFDSYRLWIGKEDSGVIPITTGGGIVINGFCVVTDSYVVAGEVDHVIICDKSSAMTVTLPAATGTGKVFQIKNIGAGTVTVSGNLGETIDGESSQSISQWENIAVMDVDQASTKWIIL